MFGSALQRSIEKDEAQRVESLSDDELLEVVELNASRPEIASIPWVFNRWTRLDHGQKVGWIQYNSKDLRFFLIEQGGLEKMNDTGRSDYHTKFIVEIQRLDRLLTQKGSHVSIENSIN